MIESGVGKLIETWIPGWLLDEKRAGCGCIAVRDEMDAIGPDGVENDLQRFVEHFIQQREHLRPSLQVIPEPALRVWVETVIKIACKQVRRKQVLKSPKKR